ncbi:hypothetical protein HRbin13_00999 [bacterium HR13]|nr:hypothetical protein HRbin13_00999 [bacterium HR13]
MFYVSKMSPFFFALAVVDLFISLVYKSLNADMTAVWVLVVFGFVAHTIMSAMYQLVPNSQSRPLRFPFLSYLVFSLSLICSLLFYAKQFYYAGYIYALASLIFSLHMVVSIKNWQPITVKFLGLAVFYFLLSSVFLMLSELGHLPLPLAVHTLTLGLMLNAVMGVQLAWIPMLYMEPLNVKYGKYLFYSSLLALPPFLLSFYTLNYRLTAYLSILPLTVVTYFLWIIYSVFSGRRMPKEIPLVVRYFILAMIFLPFGMLLGSLMASENLVSFIVRIHVDLLVYGFTAITIMGGIAHLYPRIIYGWKQSEGVSIQELVDEPLLRKLLPFVPVSVAWMVFCDAMGGFLLHISTLPYAVLWTLFFKAVLLKPFLKRKVST